MGPAIVGLIGLSLYAIDTPTIAAQSEPDQESSTITPNTPVDASSEPESESSTGALVATDDHVPVPEPSDLAVRYYQTGNALWVLSVLWSFLVPLVILFSGLSVRLRDIARRWGGNRWYPILLIYFGLYATLSSLIDLPLAYYFGFVRPHAYGLSNQLLSKWLFDMLKGFGVGMITAVCLLWIPYLLLRISPRRWWLYSGLASIPVILFGLLITPIWIAPLFNDFGPMQDQQLEARILTLAERAQTPADRVFEVDKSVDTKRVNAYVTGFAGSKRVVLWDTLLERLEDDEVVFVMGHELGHYVLGHVHKSVALSSLAVILGLYLIHRSSVVILGRFGSRIRVRELIDPAALPLLLVLFSAWNFAISPASRAYSRWQEHEADRFALELTQDNHAGASAFVELQTSNLSYPYPGPVYKLLRSTHPPIGERVDFCNSYRPWQEGTELRYDHLFEPAPAED